MYRHKANPPIPRKMRYLAFVELINVVDGGGESEVQVDSYTDPSLSNEEEMEGELCAANQLEIAPDSTTIHSDSTEVTSTLQRQG